MNVIEKKVRDLISQLFDDDFNIDKIKSNQNLFHYGLDSMSAVSLIVLLENEFDFEFPEDDLNTENIKTIDRIVNYVSEHI